MGCSEEQRIISVLLLPKTRSLSLVMRSHANNLDILQVYNLHGGQTHESKD